MTVTARATSRRLPTSGSYFMRWQAFLITLLNHAVISHTRLAFNFCPRKGLFSVTGVRWTPTQGAALELAAKTAEAMRIEATNQWGPCPDVKRSPRQGVPVVRGAPQLDVQVVKLEQPQDPDKGTQEALPDPGQETREVPLDRKEET